MNYRITHRTVYEYPEPVTVSHHAARVRPRPTAAQGRTDFSLHVVPEPVAKTMRTDYFGNRVCFFSIQQIHRKLEITAVSRVSVEAIPAPQVTDSPDWPCVRAMFRDPVSPELVEPYQFCFNSPLIQASPELADYVRQSFNEQTPLLVGVQDLNRRIHSDFKYDPVATTVATPLGEVLSNRRGVCQDFAHIAIACLRSLGLPARYVSGYLRTHSGPGKPRLAGADASHAWFSAFCPDLGWVDFDPTNDLIPAEEHITVAYGRDFSDVSPVTGILVGGGSHQVTVGVEVEQVPEES